MWQPQGYDKTSVRRLSCVMTKSNQIDEKSEPKKYYA